ncbi:MAG TPA: hypothetical protein VN782_04375 [Usitatibacter sp.]|nr:hypothetical protein [Usitatibacter sp.]
MIVLPVDKYMERLRLMSQFEGRDYGRLRILEQAQEDFRDRATALRGFTAISAAFKCFFLETVELLNSEIRPRIKSAVSPEYAMFLPRLCSHFFTLCGAERCAMGGYPLEGYTILRNVFDGAVMTAAAAMRISDFYAIEGLAAQEPFDPGKVRTRRKKEEFRVRALMTGKDSGLSALTLEELAKWDALFDMEIHGAGLSKAKAMNWMRGKGPLPVVPTYLERDFSMFINRYCEIAWVIHRLIPMIQPPGILFDSFWREKWQRLDESLEQAVASLTQDLGKKIGAAVVELVKTKFAFTAESVLAPG